MPVFLKDSDPIFTLGTTLGLKTGARRGSEPPGDKGKGEPPEDDPKPPSRHGDK